MLISITVPATNERGPVHTQHVLSAIHQANTKRLPVTLLFARHAGSVGLCCRFPAELEQTIKKQLIPASAVSKRGPLMTQLAHPINYSTIVEALGFTDSSAAYQMGG